MDKLLIKSYMEQVTRYPLLSAEEEIELSRKIQKGDEEAKMKLVNSNLRLVVSIATKYASGQNSLMDLIQEGNLGLITAAGKFNHSFNTRFGTYAHSWITQSILRYIHGHIPTISIPFRKEEKLRNIKKSEVVLKQKLGRNPTLKELAVYLDISEESVKEILLLDYSYSSLNAEIKGTEGLTWADTISCPKPNPEDFCLKSMLSANIRDLLDFLPEQEKKVLFYRFNFLQEKKPKTLRQIGDLIGVSAETVRQMEIRALRKLRTEAKKYSDVC